MKQMILRTFLNLLMVAIASFFIKSIFDVGFQWIFMKMEVREHIWGKFTRSIGYIFFDFIIHFWIYIVLSIFYYLIMMYFKKIRWEVLLLISSLLLIIIHLEFHNYEFPMKQLYFPSDKAFNYQLLNEIVVHILTLSFMLYFLSRLRKKSINNTE